MPFALTIASNRKFKLPTPATEGASYDTEIGNLNNSAFSVVVTRADGDVTHAVTIAPNFKQVVRIRPSGAYPVGPPVAHSVP